MLLFQFRNEKECKLKRLIKIVGINYFYNPYYKMIHTSTIQYSKKEKSLDIDVNQSALMNTIPFASQLLNY